MYLYVFPHPQTSPFPHPSPTGLFSVTIRQALFIAPCSHTFHYKCIRPILEAHHPSFSCPLCRTYADLEEDVEVDEGSWEVGVSGDDDDDDAEAKKGDADAAMENVLSAVGAVSGSGGPANARVLAGEDNAGVTVDEGEEGEEGEGEGDPDAEDRMDVDQEQLGPDEGGPGKYC